MDVIYGATGIRCAIPCDAITFVMIEGNPLAKANPVGKPGPACFVCADAVVSNNFPRHENYIENVDQPDDLQAISWGCRDPVAIPMYAIHFCWAIILGATKPTMQKTSSTSCALMNVTPHVAQNTSRRSSAIDGRTTRHGGYAVSRASASASRSFVHQHRQARPWYAVVTD